MNIYSRKQRWKLFLFTGALAIVAASLWYTSQLVEEITVKEREKFGHWADEVVVKSQRVRDAKRLFDELSKKEQESVKTWKEATNLLATTSGSCDLTFLTKFIEKNDDIPVIMADVDRNVITARNVPESITSDPEKLQAEIDRMAAQFEPLHSSFEGVIFNYIYYSESRNLREIRRVFRELQDAVRAEILGNAATSSVILTNEDRTEVIDYAGDIDSLVIQDSTALRNTLADWEKDNKPLRIEVGYQEFQYIFYQESFVLTQLRYFPAVIIGIVGLFMFISYLLFSTARRVEQNQVWVGMSKETAHQLGTPLSSLMAWMELLKEDIDPSTAVEIDKDIKRLVTVTDRFSKVGSAPVLKEENLVEVVRQAINYMKTRTSDKVKFSIKASSTVIKGQVNVPLFEWVVENLVRNAVDAMSGGGGSISIDINVKSRRVYIDVTDTGKGIPSSKMKTVFQPGYTTKKRGWGLGLSLTKRIVTNYHKGKIYVKRSEVGVGTTFRIVLSQEG